MAPTVSQLYGVRQSFTVVRTALNQNQRSSLDSIQLNPLVPGRTLKYVFFVLTLQPYSTVSFNTIFFKLTCTGSPVSQLSGEKN